MDANLPEGRSNTSPVESQSQVESPDGASIKELVADLPAGWGAGMETVVCERCDWTYLISGDALPPRCPHCFRAPLSQVPGQSGNLAYNQPPERYLSFNLNGETLARSIQNFASGIWFAPPDLNASTLAHRLERIYLPVWLVDAQVQAPWQAEVGYDYQVVSHRERFDERRGGWATQEVTETRIRWEPRLGRLQREYHNISAPALEEHQEVRRRLGDFHPQASQPYQAQALAETAVRLPNRSPQDAWPEAVPAFQAAAADECRQAAAADHLRDFRWKPEFSGQNWTLLLMPVYSTYYLDDEGQPQTVLIHGQTGRTSGARRASMQRAQRASLVILAVAAAIFFLSLLVAAASFFMPPLLPAGVLGGMLAIVVAVLAIAPVAMAWQFNRSQGVEELGVRS